MALGMAGAGRVSRGHLDLDRVVAKNAARTMTLELVSETIDQDLDVDRLHDLMAAMLVRRYREAQAGRA